MVYTTVHYCKYVSSFYCKYVSSFYCKYVSSFYCKYVSSFYCKYVSSFYSKYVSSFYSKYVSSFYSKYVSLFYSKYVSSFYSKYVSSFTQKQKLSVWGYSTIILFLAFLHLLFKRDLYVSKIDTMHTCPQINYISNTHLSRSYKHRNYYLLNNIYAAYVQYLTQYRGTPYNIVESGVKRHNLHLYPLKLFNWLLIIAKLSILSAVERRNCIRCYSRIAMALAYWNNSYYCMFRPRGEVILNAAYLGLEEKLYLMLHT